MAKKQEYAKREGELNGMVEIKWIKICTNIFDNRKIKQIEALPDGDNLIVIWYKLLCLAGDINDCGAIYLTKEIPYNDQMLATAFNKPILTIQLALATFEQYKMIEIINNIIFIANWEKYQNIEGMDKVREQNRVRAKRYYDNKKLVSNVNSHVITNATVTLSNAIDKDIDIDKDIKKEIYKEKDNPISDVQDLNAFISLPLVSNEFYNVYENDLIAYSQTYPAVDVKQELRNMNGWLNANPKNRKTKQGIKRFINGWLSRTQDKAPKVFNQPPQKKFTGSKGMVKEKEPSQEELERMKRNINSMKG